MDEDEESQNDLGRSQVKQTVKKKVQNANLNVQNTANKKPS